MTTLYFANATGVATIRAANEHAAAREMTAHGYHKISKDEFTRRRKALHELDNRAGQTEQLPFSDELDPRLDDAEGVQDAR